MALRNYLLLGLFFSVLLWSCSAHRLLLDHSTVNTDHQELSDSSAAAPTTSHHHLHSHHHAHPPSDAYTASQHPSYPPKRRYTLGTRPFPLSTSTPPPSPSGLAYSPIAQPANQHAHGWSLTSLLAAAAPLAGDHQWPWTTKSDSTPVIWPDLGGASQDQFASEFSYVYEEPPPSKKND